MPIRLSPTPADLKLLEALQAGARDLHQLAKEWNFAYQTVHHTAVRLIALGLCTVDLEPIPEPRREKLRQLSQLPDAALDQLCRLATGVNA